MQQQQQHQRTVAMKLPDDNINQLVKSDKVKVISQRFDWRRSSGSDNSVSCGASEQRQQQQSERRHNKLNNHHHHHHQRQLRHEQHRQQVADLKRNCNELQSVQYNKGTTAAAALVELVRQERANRRMSEPLDRSTNELIDFELARLNNLKLSDDLNYIVGSTQQHHQHQHQQRFLTGQIRAEHNRHQKSRTMIITSGNNNNNKTQQQAQGQQQAELMGTTTGEQVERPLVVVSAPSGPGDHRRQSPSLQQQQHGANESQHFDTSGENNNYYLSTSSDQLDSYHESRVDGAHNYVGQDAQQHNSHRSYQDTHDNYHHRTLDSDGGGGQYKNELFTSNDQHPQQHQASYVDLDELKINKQRQQQEQQQQQYHQVVLTDRNRIKSPPFLPESVIRVNSQATQRLPEASGSGAHEQFGESGQYSRGYLDDHAAHHHQHQLLSSSIDDDRYEHAHQQHHEHGHYHHQQHQQHHHHHHHHQQQQLTSLNTVQPSSLIRMRDGLKQSMDAHNYDQFASSSINSTYSNQNDDVSVAANLNQSFSGHHGPHSDHQTAATTTGGVSGLRHQQVLLPSSMPLVFDDSHEIIVIQGHDEQLSASGHYRGKTALSPLAPPSLAQQHDSLTSSAVGAASYTRLECSRPQQQQQQHHSNAGVDEFYNQSQGNDNRSSSGRGVNLIGGDTDGGGGRGGSGSRLSEPMDEFKVCEWQNCGNTFLDMDEFVHHLEMVHVNQEPREKNRYFCLWSNCKRNNQEFNARYKLLIHMRVHSGEKPYTCQSSKDCKKSFSRLENLKIHVRSHTGQKPYKCNYDNCSKSFTNSSDRIKHHKTHKDPKPYNCTYDGCTKRYTDPSSLRKHLRAHKRQYDGTSTSVTSTIVSGSSVFDTYNQSHAEDQLNLSYTSTRQQEQYYSGAIVSNQQSHLSSSSASVSGTYNQVHEPHQMTDYDHSKKEFESAYTASNIVYNQQAARYTDAGPTRSDATPAADHFDQSSGSGRAAPEFLDWTSSNINSGDNNNNSHKGKRR